MRRISTWLNAVALLFCALGALIFLEVIRPFREMSIDGPVALNLWVAGATFGTSCFFLKSRSLVPTVIGVAANVLLLVGASLLLWAISRANFAWH